MNVNPVELSPTVTPGSKKRKFAFENSAIAKTAEVAAGTSDKENGGGDEEMVDAEDEESSRPAKRAKSTATSGTVATSSKAAASNKSAAPKLAPKKPSRMPTLGVKPKAGSSGPAKPTKPAKEEKKKSTASITMARLNALAMPKRRG